MDRSRRPDPPGPRPSRTAAIGTAFDFALYETRVRPDVVWHDPAGGRRRGAGHDYEARAGRLTVGLGMRLDNETGLAAVSLTGLTGRVPGYVPDDRPVDLFYPVDQLPGSWQAPLVIRFADPVAGRIRRRFLGEPIDLKRLGLTEVLAELDRWKIRLVPHERVVSPPSRSLRGRLVAVIPRTRPASLVVAYLATRIQPFRIFGEGASDDPARP